MDGKVAVCTFRRALTKGEIDGKKHTAQIERTRLKFSIRGIDRQQDFMVIVLCDQYEVHSLR